MRARKQTIVSHNYISNISASIEFITAIPLAFSRVNPSASSKSFQVVGNRQKIAFNTPRRAKREHNRLIAHVFVAKIFDVDLIDIVEFLRVFNIFYILIYVLYVCKSLLFIELFVSVLGFNERIRPCAQTEILLSRPIAEIVPRYKSVLCKIGHLVSFKSPLFASSIAASNSDCVSSSQGRIISPLSTMLLSGVPSSTISSYIDICLTSGASADTSLLTLFSSSKGNPIIKSQDTLSKYLFASMIFQVRLRLNVCDRLPSNFCRRDFALLCLCG